MIPKVARRPQPRARTILPREVDMASFKTFLSQTAQQVIARFNNQGLEGMRPTFAVTDFLVQRNRAGTIKIALTVAADIDAGTLERMGNPTATEKQDYLKGEARRCGMAVRTQMETKLVATFGKNRVRLTSNPQDAQTIQFTVR